MNIMVIDSRLVCSPEIDPPEVGGGAFPDSWNQWPKGEVCATDWSKVVSWGGADRDYCRPEDPVWGWNVKSVNPGMHHGGDSGRAESFLNLEGGRSEIELPFGLSRLMGTLECPKAQRLSWRLCKYGVQMPLAPADLLPRHICRAV